MDIHDPEGAKLFPGIVNLVDQIVEFENYQHRVMRAIHSSLSKSTLNVA